MKQYYLVLLFFLNCIYSQCQVQFYSNSYTGNNLGSQTVTGVGFKPDVILIKGDAASAPIICTSTMTAGYGKDMTLTDATATVNTFFSSIDTDGFTVKTALTTHWVDFYYLCLRSQGACKVGSYVGNGASKAITGLGFQPEVVIIIPDHTTAAGNLGVCMSIRGKSIQDMKFSLGTTYGTMINSFDADGFTVAATIGSQNTKTYHYIAINDDGGTNTTSSTYAGTAAASANITAALKPKFLMVMDNGGSGNAPVARFETFVGTKSFVMGSNIAVIDMITAYNTSPAGFTRGSVANVNVNGNTFYYWGIGGSSALPVTFSSVSAVNNNGKTSIFWSTSMEKNSKSFSVLRSTDGETFESIGTVKAGENSNQVLNYKFEDLNPSKKYNYYKILETDLDGKKEESKTITIYYHAELNLNAHLYPNPSEEFTTLTFTSAEKENYTLEIIDAHGNVVDIQNLQAVEGENNYPINFFEKSNGIYLIKIINNKNFSSLLKFVKID